MSEPRSDLRSSPKPEMRSALLPRRLCPDQTDHPEVIPGQECACGKWKYALHFSLAGGCTFRAPSKHRASDFSTDFHNSFESRRSRKSFPSSNLNATASMAQGIRITDQLLLTGINYRAILPFKKNHRLFGYSCALGAQTWGARGAESWENCRQLAVCPGDLCYGYFCSDDPGTSGAPVRPFGIALLALAAIIMPWLAAQKRQLSITTASVVLRADAVESAVCGYLALVGLAGLAVNAAWRGRWADPAAALAFLPLIVPEGWEAIKGKPCCD
jgi:hypothetical protein